MGKASNEVKLKSNDDVGEAITAINAAQNAVSSLEREMNEKLQAIKTTYEDRARPLRVDLELLSTAVRDYCAKNRMALSVAAEGKKSVQFSSGEVAWKQGRPSVWVNPKVTIEALMKVLKARRLGKLIRTKHELDKQAVLRAPEAIKGMKDLRIESKEVFAIRPFGSEIEQVL